MFMAQDIIARGMASKATKALESKADLVNGKIPSDQLPSYVDDVVEYEDLAHFPAEGEESKIYVALDTGFTYRWSGSEYIQIGGQDLSNFVTLDSEQTITSIKTFDTALGGNFKVVQNGVEKFSISPDGNTYNTKMNVQGGTKIRFDSNQINFYVSIVPLTNNSLDLGSSSVKWRDLYLSGGLRDGKSNYQLTIPDTTNFTANSELLDTASEQTITGEKTFNKPLNITSTSSNPNNIKWDIRNSGEGDLDFFRGTARYARMSGTNFRPYGQYDLGSSANKWQDLYLSGTAYASQISATYIDAEYHKGSQFSPGVSNQNQDLGDNGTHKWNNLYLKGIISDGTNSVKVSELGSFPIIAAPSSTTLTDEQITQIISKGAVIVGNISGWGNWQKYILFPCGEEYSGRYFSYCILTRNGFSHIEQYSINPTDKTIGSYGGKYIDIDSSTNISINGLNNVNNISINQYYKKPQSSVSLSDGGTITDSTLKSLIQNEQPIKLNGFTCYFSCDDGTNYQYVSTRYDSVANKNHINVITIDKSTWIATFHTSDIALN